MWLLLFFYREAPRHEIRSPKAKGEGQAPCSKLYRSASHAASSWQSLGVIPF